MKSTNNKLGPFRLERVLGRGGMGEVWLGIHEAQNTRVAIKVVTTDKARVDRFQNAFRREVQAMAKLHHPGVVVVLDYGRVPSGVEVWSRKHLTTGSPYLAMELAESSLGSGRPRPHGRKLSANRRTGPARHDGAAAAVHVDRRSGARVRRDGRPRADGPRMWQWELAAQCVGERPPRGARSIRATGRVGSAGVRLAG